MIPRVIVPAIWLATLLQLTLCEDVNSIVPEAIGELRSELGIGTASVSATFVTYHCFVPVLVL